MNCIAEGIIREAIKDIVKLTAILIVVAILSFCFGAYIGSLVMKITKG